MTRGRSTTALIAALLTALMLSACGGSKSDTAGTAEPVAEPTAATGATAKADDSKGSDKQDSGDSSAKPASKSKESPAQVRKDFEKNGPPKYGSSADKKVIIKQVAAVTKAIDSGDVNTLCNKLYSADYVAQLNQQGGCIAVSSKQIGAFSDYKTTVTKIQFVSDTDAQVLLKSSFKYNGDQRKSDPTVNFKLENGQWKYYIRTQ